MSITKHCVQHRKCEFCTHRYDPRAEDREQGVPLRFCSHACHVADSNARKPAPPPRAQLVTRKQPNKRRQAVSPASPAQRAKKAAGASIISGATEGLDPAHICPRDLGGCDHPDCVVALTRAEHEAFDHPDHRTGKRLDILPHLIAHNCIDELCHALRHYRGDLIALLERVTGEKWAPLDDIRRAGFQVGCGDKVGPARGYDSPGPRHQEGRS